MEKTLKYFKSFLPFFLILATGIILISPLFTPGFFPMHDDTQVARVFEMSKALQDGMFPVRWVSDLGYGYGYPIFNFYAPFAYYVGALFVILGVDPLSATKIMIALPIFVMGIGVYFLARIFWGRAGGVVSSLLAMSAPYVALLLYVRGAISEYYALSFIPLVFLGLYKVFETGKFRFVILTAIALAGVILSHNLTSVIVSPFLVSAVVVFAFLAIRKKGKFNILPLIFAVVLGILLSAFYWLPALSEMRYTNVSSQVGGGADFRDHFVCPIQLWESQWGFGGSTEGCLDGLSFRLGKMHLLLAVLAIPLLFIVKKKKTFSALLFGFLTFVISIFMTLEQSELIWGSFHYLSYIQYPWRFIGMASLALSFVAGSLVLYTAVFRLRMKQAVYLRIFLILLLIFGIFALYTKLFQPQFIGPKTASDFTNQETLRFVTSKISDEYMPEGFIKPKSLNDVPSTGVEMQEGLEVLSQSIKTQEQEYRIKVANDMNLNLNTAYFPAWRVYVNGKMIEHEVADQKIVIPVSSGEHVIEVIYKSTRIQNLANLASGIGVLLAIVGIIIAYRAKKL